MNVSDRLDAHARHWRVVVEHTFETETSVIAFGRREAHAVALKVVKRHGDEWTSGEVVRAFQGRGVVRAHESVDGAMLLERLIPGHSLVQMSLRRDDDATDIIANLIREMSDATPPESCATVHDWAKGFERYPASGRPEIPGDLVAEGQGRFRRLSRSQRDLRLLHGDLHHSNVLFDTTRGWLAIDPKGLVGEVEYEIGAMLRNPVEHPDLISIGAVERRLTRFAKRLRLDLDRTLEWAFAQAVLSAIWSVEDGETVDARSPALRLAHAIRPLLR